MLLRKLLSRSTKGLPLSSPFLKQNFQRKSFDTRFLSSYSKIKSEIAQGVQCPARLFTGNFSHFNHNEIKDIDSALQNGKAYVMVYDRDSIAVPANERATWIRKYFNHHPNLEVRVAYGAPADKPGNEEQGINFIKKQIPSSVKVESVGCNNPYSHLLAKALGVPHTVSKPTISQLNAYQNNLLTSINKRINSPFKKIINPDEFAIVCRKEKSNVFNDLRKFNPDHPNQDSFFHRTQWNLANLNKINLPVIVGNLSDLTARAQFSNPNNAQVFDMPIYMPNQGWKIPEELAPYQPVIAKMVAAEALTNRSIANCNVYITVDAGKVPPQGYARRADPHVDGFLTHANAIKSKDGMVWGDNTYIVSDSSDLQTEFYPGPFDLSQINMEDPKAVLEAFKLQCKDMKYQQAKPYDIVKLTTNNVHAVHANPTMHYLQRCFVKVTFSERLFNRSGNTINPHFNYRFTYIPRSEGRNTQNFIGLAPVGFAEVDLREMDFAKQKYPNWVLPQCLEVGKKPEVRVTATPAVEGEILETKVDEKVITTNVARAGDMKVSRDKNDKYFLGPNFHTLYKPTPEKNIYAPNPRSLKAVKVTKNITFPATWGTRENIPAGSYIVEDAQGEKWGVHEKSFTATYRKL